MATPEAYTNAAASPEAHMHIPKNNEANFQSACSIARPSTIGASPRSLFDPEAQGETPPADELSIAGPRHDYIAKHYGVVFDEATINGE